MTTEEYLDRHYDPSHIVTLKEERYPIKAGMPVSLVHGGVPCSACVFDGRVTVYADFKAPQAYAPRLKMPEGLFDDYTVCMRIPVELLDCSDGIAKVRRETLKDVSDDDLFDELVERVGHDAIGRMSAIKMSTPKAPRYYEEKDGLDTYVEGTSPNLSGVHHPPYRGFVMHTGKTKYSADTPTKV